MASTNLIFAVPTADSSVSYDLPANDSAKLSFAPEDIDGLKMDASGGLVISFVEGGNVTLSNFQSFIDNGNTLSLADGTEVDPKLLFNALGGEAANPFPASDAMKIGIPAENSQQEITLESGKKYLFNFDLSETQGADIKDGKMTISFANGGKIVVTNYETAMASATPPELSLASKTCVVTGDELITNIQQLAASGVVDPTALTEEELEEAARAKSKIADAEMQGQDDTGPGDQTDLGYRVAAVEPAAGDETDGQDNVITPEELAAIETAAGGPAAGSRNSGYGYGSRPGSDPFTTNPDIGPIDPTLLRYQAPELTPSRFLDQDDNTNPIAGNPDIQYLDETNLSGGPISVSDTISINYGADGNGGIRPNGAFGSGGSQTGGDLSSNGVDVVVTVVGNSYVGMAGDVKVFDLVINPTTGAYTFTQYEQLDHADGTDDNDTINLNFGFTAKDLDGDSVKTTVKIVIADDAPTISGAEKTIDETDLGPIEVKGTLDHDFGQDGAGVINTSGSFTATGSVDNNVLSSSGVPITVSSTATGYTGTANGATVFTLVLDPATGDFIYTQFKNIDHADNSNPDDIITLTFGAKIVDFDGDTETAPIIINIKDDAPTTTCGCGGDDDKDFTNAERTVDETNLTGVVTQSGTLVADFGVDTPGSYSFKSGDFQSGGSLKGGALTHNGVPVVVSIINGVYTGMAGDVKVFTLELNGTNGDYKFTLLDNFDHADATNPNDVITLDFGVLASDYEGDSIEGNIRINVKDDAPIANDDVNTYDTTFGVANGNVVTGLNGGPGAADDLSTDAPNKVIKIAFEGNEIDVPATGTVSIDGANGTLTINADGVYSYQAFDTNNGGTPAQEKTFVGGPALPDFDESEALDGAEQQSLGVAAGNLGVSEGDVVSVNFVSEVAGYSNSLGVFTVDANGNLKAEKMLVKSSDAPPGQQSYTVGAGATAVGFFMIADGNKANANYAGINFDTGSLNFVYNYGQPGARDAKATDDGSNISLVFTSQGGVETVLSGPVYFSTDRGGSENLNSDDSIRVVSGIPNGDDNTLRIGFEDLPQLGDKDYNDLVFDISIKGKDCGCGPDDIQDKFVYTLQDGDLDKDKATLTLTGKDLTDDKPIIVPPGHEKVDETNLTNGVITEEGQISVNFGHDGPGTVAGNGSFTSGGSKLNGALTSGGVAVIVTAVNGSYVGKAGNVTVFTMTFDDNGKYVFKLFEQLDHADGHDDNDIITLNFGADAIDCDGDKSHTTVVVKVADDAPDAKDDGRATGEGQTITGNVTNNDIPGQDTPATVTKVTINGNDFTVPNTGTVVINGTYGTLTIDKTGQYSYTAKGNNPDGTDNFTYTLKDRDGDTDTAVLCIQVTPDDDCPIIVKPVAELVDETNLSGGAITETGTVTANFGSDGPGTFAGNNNFSSGGSRTNDTLSHNGTPVNVTYAGGTYTGTAGGVTVFTMQIATDGSYTFKLFEQLDHANGNDKNDEITLNFGVVARDSDNDSDSTTITVKVADDAPDAKDDARTAEEGQTITGNVTNNDSPGQDTPATVTKVVFNGTDYVVPNSGNVVIAGTYGTLTIDKTGAYSYTAKSNNPDGTDNFTYTLKDRDGDVDTAVLCIEVSPDDDCPIIVKPDVKIVDETYLTGGVIEQIGTVTANFFSDGPGTFAGNNSFTSGGSRTNGALTHNGTPVVVTMSGNTYTGTAGGVTVFTMAITSTGSYSFKLFEQLDHADGSNPNDEITLNFGVVAKDSDNDTDSTTITVKVRDDAPVANDDHNTSTTSPATGNVVTGLNGGPGAADVLSQDVANKVVKVSFGGNEVDVPSTGTATIEGANGTLKIAADGSYTYTAKDGGSSNGDEKTFVGGPELPDFDESEALDGVERQSLGIAQGNLSVNEGDVISVKFVGEQAGYSNTLGVFTVGADGKLKAETILIKNSDQAGSGTINYTVANGGTSAGFFIVANGAQINNNYANIDLSKGTLDFVYNYGKSGSREATINDDGDKVSLVFTAQNGTKTIIDGPLYFTSDRGDYSNLNPECETRVVSGLPNENDNTVLRVGFEDLPKLGDKDYNDMVFDISIKNDDCGCDNSDVFTYTLKDKDGDTDKATLTLDCIEVPDDQPMIIKPAIKEVDETSLSLGVITTTGTVTANFYGDGPGTFAGTNSFSSGGSRTNNALTHNGTPVNVTMSGNTYTGTAGGIVVFTMVINSNGSYTFKLLEQLDHANKSDPNDIITMNFGVKATDKDGDTDTTTITVHVKDDAPDAKDDKNNFDFDKGHANGNVVTGLNGGSGAADTLSQDVANKVTKVAFGSTSVNVPSSGEASVNGTYGKLTIKSDGTYSYKLFDGVTSGEGTTGGSALATFTAADVAGTASSITKNGITISAKNGKDLTWVNEGDGDGVGIDGLSSPKIFNGEVMNITFADNPIKAEIRIADVGANNLTTGMEYRIYVAGSSTPISGEVGFKDMNVTNGTATLVLDMASLAPGKEISKIEIYSDNAGHFKQSSLVLDSVKAYFPPDEICIEDKFVYTLTDRDGDSDTAKLTLTSAGSVNLINGDSGNNTLHGTDGIDTIRGAGGHDTLNGGKGNDWLYGDAGNDNIFGGEGNDNLIGGAGVDSLTGGAGADTFWYMAINEGVDRIKDFSGSAGDKLDLSNVVSNYDPITDAITDFVFANNNGGNTTISVNNAGTGAAGATQIAVLENVNVSVHDLFNNGNIVV